MPTDTKQRIIYSAIRLFSEKGYQATTIAEIAKASEANAGSVYFFFQTKQDILLAVLDTYCEGIEHMLLEPAWKDVPDPIERTPSPPRQSRNTSRISYTGTSLNAIPHLPHDRA